MKRIAGILVAGALMAAPAAAAAKSAPPTKMKFKLDAHEVEAGETLTGTILVLSGRGKSRAPLAGASLEVSVDKEVVGTVVTDADGRATVSYVAEEDGEHVMKVAFAGDAEHKKAKRAQGFEVGAEDDEEMDEEDLEDEA